MTITDRETPDTVTPTIEDLVLGWCDSVEQRIADVREAVAGMEAHAATVADLVGPPTSVDLRDPLAPFKMADGTVCYLSIPVGGLRAGDWFQRQHGDPDWHHVRLLIFAGDRIGVPYDEAGFEWFGVDAQVRVARPPADVVARQELREALGEARQAQRLEAAGGAHRVAGPVVGAGAGGGHGLAVGPGRPRATGDWFQCVECHMPALIHVVFTATPDQKVGNGVYAGDSYCSLACLAKGALRIPLPEHEDEDDT